ncbi:MAG: succinate dehydrogenase/fumarate reductase iron-sulfur subunit [Syntrophobacteraceae bacterium]
MAEITIIIKVFRGDIDHGKEVAYEVPVLPGMVVLDAVHYIQAHMDSSLACRWNCKAAKCGSCSAEINGYPRLMCKTRIDRYPDGIIQVRPMRTFPLIKDLVTDVAWNFEMAKKIPPLDISPDVPKPFIMRQMDVARIQEFHKCIECFLCQNVCHVIREHDRKDVYFGPRFFIKLAGFDMHPFDTLDRARQAKEEAGIGICNITKCCTEVCPASIRITDNGIIPMKERIVDEFYDPLRTLLRRIGIVPHKKRKPAR